MSESQRTDAGVSRRPIYGPHRRTPVHRRRTLAAATALSALVVLGACDGENLFTGDSPVLQPRILEVAGPNLALAGDTIGVRVTASAARQVTKINLSVRGGVRLDTVVTVTEPATQVTELVKIGLPAALQDSVLILEASAVDGIGAVSRVRTDTVIAVGPPSIVATAGADSARANSAFTFTVQARGGRPISSLLITASGAVSQELTIPITPPSRDVTRQVTIQIPAAVQDTVLRIAVAARDESGLLSPVSNLSVPLAVTAPAISMTVPATAAPGGTADLSITASSVRKVQELRIELRGAITRDTTVPITPPASTVNRSVSIPIPGSVTSSELRIRAFAVDAGGAVSAPDSGVTTINIGAPVVLSLTAPAETQGGRIVDVRVTATGVRPLTQINLGFRGAAQEDLVLPINPPRTGPVTVDASITMPAVPTDTILTVRATATDQAGDVSAVQQTTVRVKDVTLPTVTSAVTPATASSGRPVAIRVQASDNVGLRRVGYAVVDAAGDTIGTTPTLSNTSGTTKDTTFTFTLPATQPPGQVKVLGIAFDAAGLRGLSTLQTLTVVDSGVPAVTIIAPGSGATYPLGDSVLVTAQVTDITGIKSVSMKGIAIRTDPFSSTTIVTKFAEKVINFPQAPRTTLSTDTTLSRYLLATADTASEIVYIVVQATDSLNNVGVDTVDISVGGPRVTLEPLPSSVQDGQRLPITVSASDPNAGLDRVTVTITGAADTTFRWLNLAGVPSFSATDTLLVPNAPGGQFFVTASAVNGSGVTSTIPSPVTVTINSSSVADTTKPQVRLSLLTPGSRIELNDTIKIPVQARDIGGTGLARIGAVLVVVPDVSDGATVPVDTFVRVDTFAVPLTGAPMDTFRFALSETYAEDQGWSLPRRFTLAAYAFAVDASGNCGASVSTTFVPSLACDTATIGATEYYTASGSNGLQQQVTVVSGFSVSLPQGGEIADVVVSERRAYLSNIARDRIDVLNLGTRQFLQSSNARFGRVGADPWGIFTSLNADTLYVANSGGTNISFVPIDTLFGDYMIETEGRRVLTPNEVLRTITLTRSNGLVRYTSIFHDFSDRPQFIAQHSTGTLVFSTLPTSSATPGTIRYVDTDPNRNGIADDQSEIKILYNGAATSEQTDSWAVAYLDSLSVIGGTTTDDEVILYDHLPGDPSTTLQSDPLPLNLALVDLRTKGSDVQWTANSAWDVDGYALQDTTFVAASGDRTTIAFGEGDRAPTGRVILCCQVSFGPGGYLQLSVEDEVPTQDLINNADERVLGLGLNRDGSFGVARGANEVYFFSRDLRLQGLFGAGIAGGAGGAALHPDHSGVTTTPDGERLAFVGTPNQTIKIIDTVHFYERGEIAIRNNIVGPLKAYLPDPAEQTVPAGDPSGNFILVKLVGVTAGAQVVIIDIRERHLN